MYLYSDLTKIFLVTPNIFLGSVVTLAIKSELAIDSFLINVNELQFVLEDRDLYRNARDNFFLVDWEGYQFDEFERFYNDYGKLAGKNGVFAFFNAEKGNFIEQKMIFLGAQGVFYRDIDFNMFKKGVLALLEGEIWFSRKTLFEYIKEKKNVSFKNGFKECSRSLSQEDKDNEIQKISMSLTPREVEILKLISLGKSNQSISTELYISSSTVKTHIYNIFQKIHVHNRIQAALWAVKHLQVDDEFELD